MEYPRSVFDQRYEPELPGSTSNVERLGQPGVYASGSAPVSPRRNRTPLAIALGLGGLSVVAAAALLFGPRADEERAMDDAVAQLRSAPPAAGTDRAFVEPGQPRKDPAADNPNATQPPATSDNPPALAQPAEREQSPAPAKAADSKPQPKPLAPALQPGPARTLQPERPQPTPPVPQPELPKPEPLKPELPKPSEPLEPSPSVTQDKPATTVPPAIPATPASAPLPAVRPASSPASDPPPVDTPAPVPQAS